MNLLSKILDNCQLFLSKILDNHQLFLSMSYAFLRNNAIQLYNMTIENSNDLENCKSIMESIFKYHFGIKIGISFNEIFSQTHEKRVSDLIKDLKYSYNLVSENDMFIILEKIFV